MHIRILGSAAGGGLPQWNCRCPNCEAVRAGSSDVQPRTQSSVAVSADGVAWFLLNVSADVRQQLFGFSSLWPPEDKQRGTTIVGCLLTDAEIDHTSGLLQLREGCQFNIFSTALVHRWLSQYLPIENVLASFAERPWTNLPLEAAMDLPLLDGTSSGIRVRAFETGQDVPRFVPENTTDLTGSVVGFQIEDTVSGGKLVYVPGVATISDTLQEAARDADCILIDGTFWSDDEPIRMGITDRTATQMGHVPVDGAAGTLNWLAKLSIPHRVYVHINNTNPMLNERGPQWRKVNDNGVRIGADGDEFEVPHETVVKR